MTNHNPYSQNPYPTHQEAPSYAATTSPYPQAGQIPHGFGHPGPDGTIPLNQPHYGIDMMQAVVRFLKKYARFNGFASRGEFWWVMLFVFLLEIVLMVVGGVLSFLEAQADASSGGGGSVIVGLLTIVFGLVVMVVALGLIVPVISLTVRRLHDAGYSGWLYLLNLVPVGGFVVLVLCVMETKPEKWQPDWFDN